MGNTQQSKPYDWAGKVCTEYKLESGDILMIAVYNDKIVDWRLNHTLIFKYDVYVRQKGHQYYRPLNGFQKTNITSDDELPKFISQQMIYEAMHNFWWYNNPLRIFHNGMVNGKMKDFQVNEVDESESIMETIGYRNIKHNNNTIYNNDL
ncbi:hypothetical protein BPT24_086 [Tenacibaculum phage pT24]|uniref:Uncharacterized protein n=1 Tax=Tenacibaculum phage pT24 TaxID=1880590 RepID=A0A1B4XWL3_9CAUD|nr:hypothetical protein HYP10_gp086 [Tenacibaculum phage pT24]BAV39211.1 hypothetical protein BPT24_086 [Tenacibaculum phage pT24]